MMRILIKWMLAIVLMLIAMVLSNMDTAAHSNAQPIANVMVGAGLALMLMAMIETLER